MNLESWGLRGGGGERGRTGAVAGSSSREVKQFDVGVSVARESDVQLTYGGVQHTFQAGRQQVLSRFKRQVGGCVGGWGSN